MNERFELNINSTYQKNQITFKNIFTSHYFTLTSGFSKFIIAGKYLLYEQKYIDKSKEIRSWKKRHRFDWNRLIPSVAVYLGVNADFVNEFNTGEGISPKVGILFQNNLSNNLNIITNIFYDKIGTEIPETSYIITGTYNLNKRWSTFFENQTFSTKFRTKNAIASGLAFLYNKNLQINSSIRFMKEGRTSEFYTSFGISYRIDKHVDKVTETDESGNPIKDIIKKIENKSKKQTTKVSKKRNKSIRTRPKRVRKKRTKKKKQNKE